MIKAGIIGATGYAGSELVRILMGHSIRYNQCCYQDIYTIYIFMKGRLLHEAIFRNEQSRGSVGSGPQSGQPAVHHAGIVSAAEIDAYGVLLGSVYLSPASDALE